MLTFNMGSNLFMQELREASMASSAAAVTGTNLLRSSFNLDNQQMVKACGALLSYLVKNKYVKSFTLLLIAFLYFAAD